MTVIFAGRGDARAFAPEARDLFDSILLASRAWLPLPMVSSRRPRAIPTLHTVRKSYCIRRDDVSFLTALRNVGAYPCRYSQSELGKMDPPGQSTSSDKVEQ